MSRFVFCLELGAVALVLSVVPAKTAVGPNPQDASTYYEQGVILFKEEKFKEAIDAFKNAIKLNRDYAEAYERLGDTYSELGEYRKAVDAYKDFARVQPKSANSYVKLGAAYHEAGDHKHAAEAYIAALRLNPQMPGIHYKLGSIYALADKQQEAIVEYKILQTLDSKAAQELYNLIYKPLVSIVVGGAVNLKVMALDSQGVPATGLTHDDFQVTEEGEPQDFSVSMDKDPPLLLSIAIDSSGSVRSNFSTIISAAKMIVQRTQPRDEASINTFISSDKIAVVREFTSNQKDLTKAIDTISVESGQSAVVDATYLFAQRVVNYRFPENSPRRVLLVISDGEDRSSYYSKDQLFAMLRSVDVQVFCIGLKTVSQSPLVRDSSKESRDFLTRLAFETGGAVFFPKSSAELAAGLDKIFGLIRNEYVIHYTPKRAVLPKVYRPVSITILPKAGRENYQVSSRAGYVLSLPPR